MPTIAVQPIVLRDVLLTIGTDSYQKHVSGVTFTPSASTVTWQGLTPDASFTAPVTATWAVTLDHAQDWETEDSLSLYLFENEGEEVPMLFEPVAGGAGFSADVIITPGSIGGAVNSVATGSVTLGVNGRPTVIPAA